jgi:hypothetical protein
MTGGTGTGISQRRPGHVWEESRTGTPVGAPTATTPDPFVPREVVVGREPGARAELGPKHVLFLGNVANAQQGRPVTSAIPVFLDAHYPHAVLVCGQRGSGKSYTMAVILEGLAAQVGDVAAVVLDFNGVFHAMKHPNQVTRELHTLHALGIRPSGCANLRVLVPASQKADKPYADGTFTVGATELTVEDWCALLGIAEHRFRPMGTLLAAMVAHLRTSAGFDVNDMLTCLGDLTVLGPAGKGFTGGTVHALSPRLRHAQQWGVIAKVGTSVDVLCRAGQVTVIDLMGLERGMKAQVAGLVAAKLHRHAEASKGAGKPAPTWLFMDESDEALTTGKPSNIVVAVTEYLKRGRTNLLGLVLGTQRPATLPPDILSEVDIVLAHTLVEPRDVKALVDRMTGGSGAGDRAGVAIRKALPSLAKGNVLVSDRATGWSPHEVGVRPLACMHGGGDAWTARPPPAPPPAMTRTGQGEASSDRSAAPKSRPPALEAYLRRRKARRQGKKDQ